MPAKYDRFICILWGHGPLSPGVMFVVVAALLGLIPSATAFYDAFAGQLLPCPTVYPQPDVDIHKVCICCCIKDIIVYNIRDRLKRSFTLFIKIFGLPGLTISCTLCFAMNTTNTICLVYVLLCAI